MATLIYNKQIESFYRSVGEGDITVVNAASSSTLTKGAVTNYQPKRWSLEEVYDLFWRAGAALNRVVKSLDIRKTLSSIPSLLKEEEVNLSSNVGAITNSFDYIYEEAIAVKNSVNYRCRLIPFYELSEMKTLSTGYRKYPTIINPKFSLTNLKSLTVYPTDGSHSKLIIKGLLSVERLVASTNGNDSWNVHLPDLLILTAVGLAKGETNDDGLFQYILKNMQFEYQMIRTKPIINNSKQIEEQK